MFLAFLAAIFGAGGDITNKNILGRLKLPLREYLPFIFIILSVVSLFFVPFGFHFDPQAFSAGPLTLFTLMIIFAAVWNMMLSKSLQTEPLHEYEAIVMTAPIVTIIVASIFIPIERNVVLFLAGIISSLALFLSRIKSHHFAISGTVKRTFLAVIFVALEAVCLKMLLNYYSPELLYFLRVGILAIIFTIKYRPDFKTLLIKPVLLALALEGILGTGAMVLRYYGYAHFGVIATTIVLLLIPILAFAGSYFYFRERRNFGRDLACAIVVIMCIAITVLAH